ncbi:hypothetical protein EA772_14250 [Pedobacter sp. G11]|uniref:hypothetical protein n=1 Tax=Pedobacter sp. G11 TaxID=2482728 RepID=UPI000F5E94C6|nr:hypothetical protein [Pedobacter sp. G11]AZI26440.1 hypothetical protein EA772_14250 [Pedobacter sp. G11]
MSISLKEFERQYGIDLLPVSAETIILGDIWDWAGTFNQRLERQHENLASVGDPSQALIDKLTKVPMSKAFIPDIELKSKNSTDLDLNIPTIKLDLNGKIDSAKVLSFKFQGVTSKDVSGPLKAEMNAHLDKLKNADFKKYTNKIKFCEIAVWLFYADSVVLSIDKTTGNTAEIEAEIHRLEGVKVGIDNSSEKQITYTMNGGSGCPFAAQFIKGKFF